MSVKSKFPFSKKVSIPIFGGTSLGSFLLICGGGGGKQFGLPNSIQTLNFENFEQISSIDTDDCIFSTINTFTDEMKILASCEWKVSIYLINEAGKLKLAKERILAPFLKEETVEEEKELDLQKSKKRRRKRPDELLYCELCEIIQKDSVERFVLIGTEKQKLLLLNEALDMVFLINMQEGFIGISWLPHFKVALITLQSGKIVVFDVQSKKFVNEICLTNKTYSSLFAGKFSRPSKTLFFSTFFVNPDLKPYEENSKVLVGLFTFRNRKSRIVFIENLTEDPIISFQELGDIQVSCFQYNPQRRALFIGTAEGTIIVNSLDRFEKKLKILKKIKSHELPIRALIVKNLDLPQKEVSKQNDFNVKDFLDIKGKLYLWSLGLDYNCQVHEINLAKVGMVHLLKKNFLMVMVFLLAVIFYCFYT